MINTVTIKNSQILNIRHPEPDDAGDMIQYLNLVGGETDNLLFGKNEFPLSVEAEREYISEQSKNSGLFMIVGVINGEIVSIAQINSSKRQRTMHNGQIAISVKKAWWNLGIGSAMMNELISRAKEVNIKNVSLAVKADNVNAIKLYEKYGFRKIGVHKDYFRVNGVYYDEILMDLML